MASNKAASETVASETATTEIELPPILSVDFPSSKKSALGSCSMYHSYFEEGFRSKDPGAWFWLIIVIIPTGFLSLLFGVLPLGDPQSRRFHDWAVFALCVCPLSAATLSYFHMVAFLFCMQVDRPFRVHIRPVVLVFCVSAALASLVWSFDDGVPPRLFGAYTVLIAFATVWIGALLAFHPVLTMVPALPLVERACVPPEERKSFFKLYKAFLIVEFTVSFYFVLLVLYVFAWRFGGQRLQRFLPLILTTLTFIFRKLLLSLTHPFPLEVAMFVAGFWVENMEDMFAVLAFPSVANPSSYVIIWAIPAFYNLANLLFLTHRWFLFRIWVKEFLKRVFTCGAKGSPCNVHEVPDNTEIADERGHSNNHPGYRRRQVRFFIWKIVSQFIAMMFYLIVSLLLRYGRNKNYYPFNKTLFCSEDFKHSLGFAAGNIMFVVLAGFLGLQLVRRFYPPIYEQMRDVHSKLFVNHKYVGFVVAVIVHNGVLAINMILVHNQVWFGFDEPDVHC